MSNKVKVHLIASLIYSSFMALILVVYATMDLGNLAKTARSNKAESCVLIKDHWLHGKVDLIVLKNDTRIIYIVESDWNSAQVSNVNWSKLVGKEAGKSIKELSKGLIEGLKEETIFKSKDKK